MKEKQTKPSKQQKLEEKKNRKKRLEEAKQAEKERAAKRKARDAERKARRKARKADLKAEKKIRRAKPLSPSDPAYDPLRDDTRRKKVKQLSFPELAHFCEQMSMILKAGISSLEGIEMMEGDYTSRKDQDLMLDIRLSMEETGELSSSMKKTGVFPDYMIDMIKLGEESGSLDDVMDSLERYYTREEQLRTSIQSAVFYPLIMSSMIVVVITVLLVRVMPIFNQVFKQLGTEMTGLAAVLMNFGDLISRYSIVIVIVLALALLLALFCVKTQIGRRLSRSILRLSKSFRTLNEQVATCRFAEGMSIVFKSGMDPATKGFPMVRDLNEDSDFEKKKLRNRF